MNVSKANFRIARESITDVKYDSSKKWGMGYYPHDGKVYVNSSTSGRREFIIMGNQSGKRISEIIVKK